MAAGGGIIGGEEAIKQGLTDERTNTEGALITAAGFIVPALFPSIPNGKSAKKFDKYADMYDRADDEVFNNTATVGAASPKGSKLKTEADYQDLNKPLIYL